MTIIYIREVWNLMRLETLIFGGFDWSSSYAMLLQVHLATSVKVIISHSMYMFVWALIRNLFCSGGGEQYLISFKAEMCNRIVCDSQKRWWRDITECVGTESMSQAQCFDSESILKMEKKGWLTMLEMRDQALLSQMTMVTLEANCERYLLCKYT
jgi:hypothetical protein